MKNLCLIFFIFSLFWIQSECLNKITFLKYHRLVKKSERLISSKYDQYCNQIKTISQYVIIYNMHFSPYFYVILIHLINKRSKLHLP